jgi:hypothetical protein
VLVREEVGGGGEGGVGVSFSRSCFRIIESVRSFVSADAFNHYDLSLKNLHYPLRQIFRL